MQLFNAQSRLLHEAQLEGRRDASLAWRVCHGRASFFTLAPTPVPVAADCAAP